VAPSTLELGRRILAWMIPMSVSVDTTAQTILALRSHDLFAFLVWLGATILLAFLATSVENVKRYLEDY
jgi:hypothetical protein